VKKRQLFVFALIAVLAVILLRTSPSSDEWIDFLILGRIPGTTVFVSFEFMFVAYVIAGMLIARVLTDVRNDYWRFRFFKLKANRAREAQTAAVETEEISAPAAEAQTIV
jgi:hypothetical protein